MSLIDRMRRSPASDWTIRDIEAVCRQHGIACMPPSGGGSHYKVSASGTREILTIPANRPIKPVHIRKPVRFIEAQENKHGSA